LRCLSRGMRFLGASSAGHSSASPGYMQQMPTGLKMDHVRAMMLKYAAEIMPAESGDDASFDVNLMSATRAKPVPWA